MDSGDLDRIVVDHRSYQMFVQAFAARFLAAKEGDYTGQFERA